MVFDVGVLFKIGAMGILLIVIEQLLKANGKNDIAVLANLAGIVIILITIIGMVSTLFDTVRAMFTMEIIRIISIALIALFLYIFVKEKKSDIAVLIILAASIIILLYMITQLGQIVSFINSIAAKANIDIVYIEIILKILAIAYLASFCSEICKDAGAGSLASKVEFSAKIMILVLAIPILMAVLDSILQIL